jgi:O-antigen ligase
MIKSFSISILSIFGIVYFFFRQYFNLPQSTLFIVPFIFIINAFSIYVTLKSSLELKLFIFFSLSVFLINIFRIFDYQDFYGFFIILLLTLSTSSSTYRSLLFTVFGVFVISLLSHYYVFVSRFTNINLSFDVTEQYIPSGQLQAICSIFFFTLFYYFHKLSLKLLFFLLFILSVGLQLFSFSRGGVILVILLFISSGLYILFKTGINFKVLFLSLIILFSGYSIIIDNFADLINFRLLNSVENGFSDEKRFEVYERAFLGLANSNLFIGEGIGSYKLIHTTHPHNSFIQIFEDFGFFGLLLYSIFTIIVICKILNRLRRTNIFNNFFISFILITYFYFFFTINYSGNFYASFIYHILCGFVISFNRIFPISKIKN